MTIKVDIYPKNIEVTSRISDYIDKKVSKLDRYLPDIEETRVDLEFQKSMRSPTDRQVAQITIRGRGYILRTEERSDDIFAAIDLALNSAPKSAPSAPSAKAAKAAKAAPVAVAGKVAKKKKKISAAGRAAIAAAQKARWAKIKAAKKA